MKKRAFTLVELIIVISIISIFASLSLVKFNILGRVEEEREIKTFIADMTFCKEKSMVTGLTYSCTFSKKAYVINSSVNFTGKAPKIKPIKRKFRHLDFTNAQSRLSSGKIKFYYLSSPSEAFSFKILGEFKDYKVSISPVSANISLKEQ